MAVTLSPAIAPLTTPTRPQKAAEPKKPTVLQNLVTENKAMVAQIGADLQDVVEHPISSLGHMVESMLFPMLHPVTAVRYLENMVKRDPVGGTIDSTGAAAGMATIGLVVVAGLAALAAPLTAGASLAVSAGALSAAETLGTATIAIDATGFALHEVRGAKADSADKAAEEGQNSAAYVEDQMLNLVATLGGNVLETHPPKATGNAVVDGTIGRISNNTVGLLGVYDSPAYISKLAQMHKHTRVSHPGHVVGGAVLNETNPNQQDSRDRLQLSSQARQAGR